MIQPWGLRAIYQKPRTTVPGSPSERFPYLVDRKQVTRVDQDWSTDITCIPLQKGFLYLVAIVDLFSRNVLSWKLSNSCPVSIRVLGLAVLPVPEAILIFNVDLHFGMHTLPRYYQSAQVISMYSPGAFVITQLTSSFC